MEFWFSNSFKRKRKKYPVSYGKSLFILYMCRYRLSLFPFFSSSFLFFICCLVHPGHFFMRPSELLKILTLLFCFTFFSYCTIRKENNDIIFFVYTKVPDQLFFSLCFLFSLSLYCIDVCLYKRNFFFL